jgi:hypothetical protein
LSHPTHHPTLYAAQEVHTVLGGGAPIYCQMKLHRQRMNASKLFEIQTLFSTSVSETNFKPQVKLHFTTHIKNVTEHTNLSTPTLFTRKILDFNLFNKVIYNIATVVSVSSMLHLLAW